MCRIDETTEKNKKVIQGVGEVAVAVDSVRQSFKGGAAANPKEKDHTLRQVTARWSKEACGNKFQQTICGTRHRVRECPAFQKSVVHAVGLIILQKCVELQSTIIRNSAIKNTLILKVSIKGKIYRQ
jgi:hypothetical protein